MSQEFDLEGDALGELDAASAARVAQHLEQCGECRAALRQIEETLGWLGAMVPLADPPSDLRARILTLAGSGDRSRWRLAWARRLLVGGAGLLLVALILAIGLGERQRVQLEQQRSAVLDVLVRASWGTALQSERAGWPAEVGRVYLSPRERTAVVAVTGITWPGEGQVYQLWLLRRDGRRESGGVFLPDRSGRALLFVEASQEWTAYQGMSITIEPAPHGSEQPTGERVAGCTWDWKV